MGKPGREALDEALEMLAPYGPSYRGGLSNHGPMTAEALVSLGRHDAVIDWVKRYRARLEDPLKPRARIAAPKWREALGDRSRGGDWEQWFQNELAESPWREVVARWVPRLAPGMAAAGLHGVIRAGHAVCSIAVVENPLRRAELARALAYWATEYLELPGRYSRPGKLAPASALAHVPRLPDDQRLGRGLISTELRDLIGFEAFPAVIDLVDPSAGSPTFLSDLIATFAGTFTNTTVKSFDFLHAVTGAAAVAELTPYVAPADQAGVKACIWQVNGALFARYSRPGLDAAVEPRESADFERLAKLAVASGDEHTIKLTAACRREWQRNQDHRLLTATAKRVSR
ncbi:MAG: questin oxidase family protein [bacterium]|nr:questin oxidase family protein [bacterium]